MKKILKWTCSVLTAGILLLLLAYVLRGHLIAPYLSRLISHTVAAEFGVELAIGRISGSYFSGLEISDLITVRPHASGPLVSLDLDRLTARYSLLSLLHGLDRFMANLRVDICGARIVLAVAGDGSDAVNAQPFEIPALSLPLPNVQVRNSTLTIQGGTARTRFDGIAMESRSNGPTAAKINLSVSEWSWHHPLLHDLAAELSLSATVDEGKLAIDRLDLGKGMVVASAGADLRQAPETLPFQAKAILPGGDIDLTGSWTRSGLRLKTSARGLDLTALPAIFRLPFDDLGGIVDWKADADLNPDSWPSGTARLELGVSKGRIAGRLIERIDLTAALQEKILTIARLETRASGNTIRLEGVQAPAPLVFAGDIQELAGRIRGEFSIQAGNLPAAFGAFGAPMDTRRAHTPHALSLQGQFDEGTLVIADGRLTAATGSVTLRPSRLQIPTPAKPWRQSTIQGGCMADISALGPIAALFALPAIGGSVKADIDFAGTLGAPAGRAFIQAERLVWRDFAVDSATLSGSANTERVAIDTLEMVHGRDRISGNGIYHLPSANLQETRLTLKVMDLRPYLSMLASAVDGFDRQMQGFNGSISGSVFLSGPPLRPDGKADLAISGIAFQDRPFGDVVVDVRKQGGRITAKRLNLKRGEDVITVKGVIDLAAESAESLALSARIADIGWYAQVLLPRAWAVSGTVNLDAEASGSLARPEARIRAEFKQLGVGSRIQIDSAALRAHSDGRVIHVDAAASAGADAAVSLSGEAATHWAEDAVVMHVTTCDIQFHDLALSLEQRSRVDYRRDGSISVDRLTLKGPSGSVGLNGTTAPDGPSGLQLEIADLTGAEWFEALVGIPVRFGRLNGAFQLSGELRQPSFSGAGSADRIVIENYPGPLNGEFDFSYTGGGLDVRRLNLRGPAGPDLSVNGNFPVRLTPKLALLPGPLEATGRFSLPDLRLVNAFTDRLQVSGGDLHGEFQIGGSWRQPGGRILFRGGAVDLDPRWRPFPPGPFTFQCDLNIEDTHLTIQSLRLDSPSLSASGGGAWKNIPSPAAFIEGNAKRPYGELAVEGKLAIPDLGWLARGVDGLRRTSGRLDADLRLTGSAAEPVFATVIRISDGELQSNVGIPPMRAIQLNARLNAEGLALDRLEAQMGGAPVQASGFLQWGGRADQTAELTVKGTNLLLYRDQDVMLRADTDLRLQGPVARMSLSGEVAVTKGTVKRNLNIFGSLKKPVGPKFESAVRLFSLPEPPLRDMRFDVRLTSRAPIDIRGNIAHGPVRPDLRLGGTGLLPVLTGRVYVDATRLRLPAGRLMIESGLVQFLETDPEVPVLDLKGSARMLGYDINVLVSGHFNEPEITLSSVPPLPGDELMLLLLTGQPPKDTLGRQGKYRQNVQVAVYVAKDLFAGWFSEDSSEGVEDILDRFDFQIGRDVTSSGDETLEAQFRVADGFILDRGQLFITGEKDAYDYINTGIKLVFRFK